MWQERFFDDVSWPVALHLEGADLAAAVDWFTRLEQLYAEVDDSAASLALLRHLVSAVLLDIARRRRLRPASNASAAEVDRLRRFKLDVERSFRVTRQVGDYATRLGCSARTLDRACQKALGVSAKRWISDRVVLEAKRLLGHTGLTVAAIGEELGFSEPTNFTKFFRAEAGALPQGYRALVQRRGSPQAGRARR
jgi:AraC-like DNA-binding protein